MPVVPRQRREGQNTGLRAKTALHVTDQPCPSGGLHVLVNDRDGVTACVGCSRSWGDLDGELNQRGESWLG